MGEREHLDRRALTLTALASGPGQVYSVLNSATRPQLLRLLVRWAAEDAAAIRAKAPTYGAAVDRVIGR